MPVIDTTETVRDYLTPDELAELGFGYLVPMGTSEGECIDVDEIFGI